MICTSVEEVFVLLIMIYVYMYICIYLYVKIVQILYKYNKLAINITFYKTN